MKQQLSYISARDMLLERAKPVGRKTMPLEECYGRILADDIYAGMSIPPFDRSPYDGYAVKASDTRGASRDNPVVLDVMESIPAGSVPQKDIVSGKAARIMTGAPMPRGADAVVMFEKTEFTDEWVKLFSEVESGSNVVTAGEDVHKGRLIARAGERIDAGVMGMAASQGMADLPVYAKPVIGIISTGTEVVQVGSELLPGKIYDSNRFTLLPVIQGAGCEALYLGLAGDRAEEISALITKGLDSCDAVLLTGGVSVGDYDVTAIAMQLSGAEVLIRSVAMKPGMACAFGTAGEKLVCALSGNPAAAATSLIAVVLPSLRRLCGMTDALLPEVTVTLADGFDKPSKVTRILRGKLDLSDGTARMRLSPEQGNVVLASVAGCDVMAVVPAGSGPLAAGTELKGFLL
ncbi:MAG: molybdopterin molybdotransferase MoeA [Clostridia bacterium]|nr:molybdopterin molybdotransferase MoeA [Clostridia bacterium]